MKMKKVFALLLAILCMSISIPFTAQAESLSDRIIADYDFSQMSDLNDISTDSIMVGELVASECVLSNGKLVIRNNATKTSAVRLLDYERASQAAASFTVTMRASFSIVNSGDESKDEHRMGIAYNLDAEKNNYSYAMLREKGTVSIGAYVNAKWKADAAGDITPVAGFKPDTEYTVTLKALADETLIMTVSDDEQTLFTFQKSNLRSGNGLGVYVRGCEVSVSSFTVTEHAPGSERPVVTGTKFAEETFDSITDISQLPGFANVLNTAAGSYSIENGALRIANNSAYSVFQLFDSLPETNAYTVVMKGKMTVKATSFAYNNESKQLLGIAYNIDPAKKDYQTAMIRSSGMTELSSFRGAAWSSSTVASNAKNIMRYVPSETFEIAIQVHADGMIRMMYNGVWTTMKWNAAEGKGIGIIARNSEVFVDSISVYEDAANSTRLVGVQNSQVTPEGTYSVRFVAALDSSVGNAVGFHVVISANGVSGEVDLNSSTVYTSVCGSDEAGIQQQYSAGQFGGNYLVAIGITDIPTQVGMVTFTVTPYYRLSGVSHTSQSYEVVYDAGVFINSTAVDAN